MIEFDINRELAENAAQEYSEDKDIRHYFAQGYLAYCEGCWMAAWPAKRAKAFTDGWIAARDAPE